MDRNSFCIFLICYFSAALLYVCRSLLFEDEEVSFSLFLSLSPLSLSLKRSHSQLSYWQK